MSFAQLIEEVTQACEDELGDAASITDGITQRGPVKGFYRREWSEWMSGAYGFTQESPSFECQRVSLAGLNLQPRAGDLRLVVNGQTYQVMDVRPGASINVLLVLAK